EPATGRPRPSRQGAAARCGASRRDRGSGPARGAGDQRPVAAINGEPRAAADNAKEEETMSLTLEEANRIGGGAVAKARELNIKITAAVCDSGGRLIALQRMDNAIWASVYGSQGKAVASAAFGRPSGEMAARADQPTPRGIAAAEGGHMIMGQG